MECLADEVVVRQPNMWTCYPTCLSIITGASIDTIISLVGHDGSRIIDGREAPWNREAFVFSEMALAALKLGWSLSCMHAGPVNEGESGYRKAWPPINELLSWLHDRFDLILCVQRVGRLHAVAWRQHDEVPLDPNPQHDGPWRWENEPIEEIDVLVRIAR